MQSPDTINEQEIGERVNNFVDLEEFKTFLGTLSNGPSITGHYFGKLMMDNFDFKLGTSETKIDVEAQHTIDAERNVHKFKLEFLYPRRDGNVSDAGIVNDQRAGRTYTNCCLGSSIEFEDGESVENINIMLRHFLTRLIISLTEHFKKSREELQNVEQTETQQAPVIQQ